MLYKLLQGKYHVVVSVGYDDVQRICLKGAVTMATPAAVIGDVRDAPHLAASGHRLACLAHLGISRDLDGCFWPRSIRDGDHS